MTLGRSLHHGRAALADGREQINAPDSATTSAPPGLEAPPQHLLDLPPDLLSEVLTRSPWHCRLTCRTFRSLMDTNQAALSLAWTPAAAVRLGPPPPPPTLADYGALLSRMPRLRSLTCRNSPAPCTSLVNLCPALTALNLTGSRWLDDLSPLAAGLPLLTTLQLASCVALADIRPLVAATAMTFLDLSHCLSLVDITPLASCTSLLDLNLQGSYRVADVTPVASCVSLSSLAACPLSPLVGFTDMCPVTMLRSLTKLDLMCGTALTHMQLAGMTWLRKLQISHNEPGDLAELAPLAIPSLTQLHIVHGAFTSLQPLAACTALAHLTLTSCRQLESLGSPAACARLWFLSLSGCDRLRDLGPLSECTLLRGAAFYECPLIADVGPLQHCRSLGRLTLQGCAITDADGLRVLLRSIAWLSASVNGVEMGWLKGASQRPQPVRRRTFDMALLGPILCVSVLVVAVARKCWAGLKAG